MPSKDEEEFKNILYSISKDKFLISPDVLYTRLRQDGFFEAPASTMYHNAFKGGLCKHTLNVYANCVKLITEHSDPKTSDPEAFRLVDHLGAIIPTDSVKTVCLMHDIEKMYKYEPSVFNQKIYSENGSQHDSIGRYDWVAKQGYKVSSGENRFYFSSHGNNSQYLASQYMKLTYDESLAIVSHSGYAEESGDKNSLTYIFNSSPLSLFLHLADMEATFYDEVC